MKRERVLHFIGGLALSALTGLSLADDTDIYMNPRGSLPPGSR